MRVDLVGRHLPRHLVRRAKVQDFPYTGCRI